MVIFASLAFGKKKRNLKSDFEPVSQLDSFSLDLFKFSDFPTALFDLNLQLVAANNQFGKVFKNFDSKSFALLSETKIKQNPEVILALNRIKNEKHIPEKPFFIFLNQSLVDNNAPEAESHCYVLLRRLHPENGPDQKLVLIIIDTDYSRSVTNDLINKMAQKDQDFKKLEELDQLKSEFLATLSHELKTPLVSIKGYLDLMASEKMGPLTEKQEKAIRVSLKNTSHLNSLISSILNFARMEAGKLMFDLSNQRLAPHINDILDSLRPIADNRQITLQAKISEDLPMVIIDAELIHRVLINLIENAVKFSPPGSKVLIEARKDSPERIIVEVKDHGRGIPADKIEKIKTPFFQADKSDTRPTGGLGLGLAIAEKILVGHGTSLTIESQENKGTTCSFYLKAAQQRN